MLKSALKAGLPLITCHTTDIVNVEKVLATLAGVGGFTPLKAVGNTMSGKYLISIGDTTHSDYLDLIEQNIERERVLVIVNPEREIPEAFDAGEVPVPMVLVRYVIKQFHLKKKEGEEIRQALAGLTLKEMGEVLSLCQAENNTLELGAVMATRRKMFRNVRGVLQVETHVEFYWLDERIEKYIQSIGQFLTMDVDYRLRPRGLLLSGTPGTGKTMGAKHIATSLGVPMMRLDLGIVMSKYVGESEANLAAALKRVEEAQPCVMLIDEIEKLFHGEDESGVTQNLLAGLLWWLQEHRAAVLTIMTTNDTRKLPPELIRPGRIDTHLKTKTIEQKDRAAFIRRQVQALGYDPDEVVTIVEPGRGLTQAILSKYVIASVRKYELTNAK